MSVHATEIAFAPAQVPEGTRIYAIGDVHGQFEKLTALWAAIARDAAAAPETRRVLVHLGDYVDRGPRSRDVIEGIRQSQWLDGMTREGAGAPEAVALSGNHEAMMLDALDAVDEDPARFWIENGGAATLRSYGLDPRDRREAWEWAIEPSHLGFLRGLKLLHREGGYLFVHAGIRPGVAIEAQLAQDLLWIREPFLSHGGEFGVVVVHGHTPAPLPVVRSNRIGVDTAAAFGGSLTCLVLWADRMRFLSVGDALPGRS